LRPSRREILLSAAFAIWGLAIAISLASVWTRPAPPGQIPGLATRLNFDAHGPMRWIAGMILIPLLAPLLLRPVARRLAEGREWAATSAFIAPLVTLWFVLITRAPLWAILPTAAVVTAATLLRNRDLGFTRRDIVLVPVLLATLLGVNDLAASISIDRAFIVAALVVFALRIAVSFIPSPLPPALAFIAAPLGLLLQTSFLARDQRYAGWPALAIAVLTPFVLRLFVRNARRSVAALVFATLPLSLAGYINATGALTAEGKPHVDVFEDSHPMLPASEYLERELPFRDVIPTHGLIEDGLLDFLIMRTRGATIGDALKTRETLGLLNVIALYALAWALTGSAEMAFLAVLLALLTNSYVAVFRVLPTLVALALMCGAARWRRLQWLRYAALATVIAGATSIDFGAYTFLTLVVAVLRFPGNRLQAIRAAAMGILIGVVPLFGGFAVLGILDDFFRTTFVELLSLGPVYTLTMFNPPEGLAHTFPEALLGLFNLRQFQYLVWCLAAVVAAVTISRRPRRRLEPIVLIAFFITVCAISYAERHHLYFGSVAAPFLVALAWIAARRRPALAAAFVLGFLILAAPTTHLGVVGWIRDVRGPVEPTLVEVPEIPRARGALFQEHDAAALRGVKKYASLALAPEETWLDFSNRGIFYFLLRRDCPIRQPEVAFYQTEEKQREVIQRLENDPRIRAVLLPGPSHRYIVDTIPNQERAPLVWQYIEAHFEPDFEEGDVVIWRRK
jgi:hypothetical protein